MRAFAMANELAAFIVDFLQSCSAATILEVTIDTSAPDCTPYANLWAWTVHAHADFDQALTRARAEDDLGFLYDVLDEQRSSCFERSVAWAYPRWPDDLDAGDAAIRNSIARALKTSGTTVRAFFHHVDTLELEEIRPAA